MPRLAPALCCLLLAGCSQADPPGTTDADAAPGSATSYFPLIAGASFTYRHIPLSGSEFDEEVTMVATEYQGRPAILASDFDDVLNQQTTDTLVVEGSQVLRVHKDVLGANGNTVSTVDYVPGFVRFDSSWPDQVGQTMTFSYDRTEFDAAGNVLPVERRDQEYSIIGIDEIVSVPSGEFSCVHFARDRGAAKSKEFWFARGVGKVKEVNLVNGNVEELARFSVPGP